MTPTGSTYFAIENMHLKQEVARLMDHNAMLIMEVRMLEQKNNQLAWDDAKIRDLQGQLEAMESSQKSLQLALEEMTEERDKWHKLHDAAALGWA